MNGGALRIDDKELACLNDANESAQVEFKEALAGKRRSGFVRRSARSLMTFRVPGARE